MSVVRPTRRARYARGARVGTAASTLAILAACADRATVTEPAAAIRTSVSATATTSDVVRRVHLAITGKPTPGYILTSVTLGDTLYAVAFDTTGSVAWSRAFPGSRSGNFTNVQPSGDISVYLGASRGWEPTPGGYTDVRPTGVVARQLSAPAGYYTDGHELREGAGTGPTYLLGYVRRPMDLRPRGGKADSVVAQHTIFRVDASGNAKPVFVAADHFTVADWINPETLIQDFDHPNGIDVDADGALVVSWRNFDEISKIDPNTGQFVWRLGGRHSDFRFVNDPLNGFSGQHFARLLPSGNILVYDNGNSHVPQLSRAVEYKLDRAARTATLVFEYRHSPSIYTPFVGSVQRFANGNTVVGFGNVGVVAEVSPSGERVWEGQLTIDGRTNILAYRLIKVATIGHLRP